MGQQSISRFGIQNVMDLTTGMQGCCNDTTEKCLEYCANYLHVFHHLDRSDTMEELLVKVSEFSRCCRNIFIRSNIDP